MSKSLQFCIFLTVVLPFVGLGLAIWLWLQYGLDPIHLWLFGGMYVATGLGVTVGFHRLFTHRSFETTRPIKFLLAVCGSMAVEGPIIEWVATHRRHHQHSDEAEDPHSPSTKGLWHAHTGWLFTFPAQNYQKWAGDLVRDRLVNLTSRLFPLWVVLGLILPAAIGGLVSQTWQGAGLGLLWGGLVRVFFVHHITWSINSACHLWGTRPYRWKTGDDSRNNVVFGILGFGEGWHNNHHAFPNSARHGLRWWQIDTSYLVIKLLEALGLAWKVQLPAITAPPA